MSRLLREVVRSHIANRNLDAARLASLDALARDLRGRSRRPASQAERWSWVATALAASLLLGLFLGWQLAPGPLALPERVAAEVVNNHLKEKPLDLETGDLRRAQKFFDRLDFAPAESQLIADSGSRLIGGRYCSLQGAGAAQLRLQDPITRETQTLYQAAYDPLRFEGLPRVDRGEPPLTVWAKGVAVRIWVEKGLVFALAGGAAPNPDD